MIDREAVARAVMLAQGCGLVRGVERVFCTHCDCGEVADAAIAAVLDQLREPVLELASDLEGEVRHRWGDDIRLAHKVERDIASAVAVRAFLQPAESDTPAE